jgi:hypothetical protein
VRVRRETGEIGDSIDVAEPVDIELAFDVLAPDTVLVPACRITNQEGVILFQTNDWTPERREVGHYVSVTRIPGNLLAEGTFYVSIGLATPSPTIKRLFESDAVAFQVADSRGAGPMRAMWGGSHPGVIRPELPWHTTFTPARAVGAARGEHLASKGHAY